MKTIINNLLKYIFLLFICISMPFSTFPLCVFADVTYNIPTTTTTNETIYYKLDSADDLYWFAEQVNGGNTAINAVLTDNIVINENVLINGSLSSKSSSFKVWVPIGNSTQNVFSGIFDGNGYIISGLYSNCTNQLNGFFARNSGTIINTTLIDVYLAEGDDEGASEPIGGICADNSGTISNCSVLGYLRASASDRDGVDSIVGGICGYNSGKIESCYNNANIFSNASASRSIGSAYAGGICGINAAGTISSCYNTGTINSVSGTHDWLASAYSGGICASNTENGKIEKCCNNATVTSESDGGREAVAIAIAGGICGTNNSSTIVESFNTGSIASDTYISGNDGYESAESSTGGITAINQKDSSITRCSNVGELTATSYAQGGYTINKGNIYGSNLGTYTPSGFSASSFEIGAVCSALEYHCYFDGICSLCGFECNKHSFTDYFKITAPTCSVLGKNYRICNICKLENIEEIEYDLTNHNYETSVVHSTCVKNGYDNHQCLSCGDIYKDNFVDALGHSYNSVVTPPLVCEQGYTTHTCDVCQYSYTDTYTEPEHDFAEDYTIDIPATDFQDGTMSRHCLQCDAVTDVTTIPSTSIQHGTCGQNVKWAVKADGTLYIVGSGSTIDCSSYDAAPWFNCSDIITSIEIAEEITYIGDYSFYSLKNLKTVKCDNPNITFSQYPVFCVSDVVIYGNGGGTLEKYAIANHYTFIKPKKLILGDVNFDEEINCKDFATLIRYINGWNIEITVPNSDINGDGNINNKDASILLQYLNGWPTDFI